MSVRIRVPATSANLGPGFDCLGMALDLWNEVEIEAAGRRLEMTFEGEGQSVLPADESNAIVQSMAAYAAAHGRSLPAGIRMHCANRIPLGSGLGSSSAAVVAGILAASALLGLNDSQDDQLQFAFEVEGHMDNVAPCLLGGLVVSVVEGKQVVWRKLPVTPFPLAIVLPDYNFPTAQARAALPQQVPHTDAVFNMNRIVLLVEALRAGDPDLLAVAMQDRLHQPYRLPLIPGAEAARKAALEAGAAAVVLSGAGPSLLAVLRDAQDCQPVADAMVRAFGEAGLSARVLSPVICEDGASVE
jgi:homoserine kinase